MDGCNRPARARGWCNAHYIQWRRHGDPLGAPAPPNIVWQWVMTHVTGDPYAAECVDAVGVGSLGNHGYREVKVDGQRYLLHRLVCEAAYGPPPTPKHQVAHSCGTRACQNLLHLRWATQAENEADKVLHGTHNRGERNPGVKLSDAEVARIRTLWLSTTGVTQREIGDRFHVRQQTISKIVNGKSRKYS